MATKNIVPRATGEGGIGTALKKWLNGYFANIVVDVLKNSDGNAYIRTIKATTAPTDTTAFWLDTSVTPNVLKWYDTTNSTWISKVSNSDSANYVVDNGMPTGALIDYAGSTVPDGYLVCDGSAVSRTTYANLFTAIGTTYGTGDGSTTFTLPNLIDRVKQGSATVGTYKSAGLPNITGSFFYHEWTPPNPTGSGVFLGRTGGDLNTTAWTATGHLAENNGINFDAARSNSIYGNSTTVQPPALTVLPCIKY